MAVVAQLSQHDVHPLLRQQPSLRHPRPLKRDSAKAQRMLGLISDSEEKSDGLQRQRSKTTKWLERPMYAHLDVSDVESEKEEDNEAAQREKALEALGGNADAKWTTSKRPTSYHSDTTAQMSNEPKSKLDSTFVKRRPQPLTSLRPVSYNPQHLLTPEWTASPAAMSPHAQCQHLSPPQPRGHQRGKSSISSISSSESSPRTLQPRTWPNPRTTIQSDRPVSFQPPKSALDQEMSLSLGSPQFSEQRPRPNSFVSYPQRDRRNSKIASSRGLRNNSYPNFSRPNPSNPPRVIPGENIEGETVCDLFADNEVGPPSPASPVQASGDPFGFIDEVTKEEKKPKSRWSTIQTLTKFARRRSSAAADKNKPSAELNLPQHNLLYHENQAVQPPATPTNISLATKALPTPTYSPLEFKVPHYEAPLPKPFAPWADAPPSPALSQKRGSLDILISPLRKRASSHLSVENVSTSRPTSSHSRNSSITMPSPMRSVVSLPPQVMFDPTASPRLGSRRGTPSLERSCIICKCTKEPSAFVNRRISGNCWHEPATCYQCLKVHIEGCVTTKGWDDCSCPECGERLTYDDLSAFADDNSLIKWED